MIGSRCVRCVASGCYHTVGGNLTIVTCHCDLLSSDGDRMNPIEAQARRRQRERRKKKMRSGEAGDYNVRTILHGRMIQPNKIFVFLSPPPHGHFPTNRRRRKTNGQIRLTVRSFIATGPVIRSARRDVRQRQQRHHTAKNHSNQPRETTLTKRHGHDLIHPYTPPAKNDDTTDT